MAAWRPGDMVGSSAARSACRAEACHLGHDQHRAGRALRARCWMFLERGGLRPEHGADDTHIVERQVREVAANSSPRRRCSVGIRTASAFVQIHPSSTLPSMSAIPCIGIEVGRTFNSVVDDCKRKSSEDESQIGDVASKSFCESVELAACIVTKPPRGERLHQNFFWVGPQWPSVMCSSPRAEPPSIAVDPTSFWFGSWKVVWVR